MPAPMSSGAAPKSKAGVIGLVALVIGFVVGYGMGRVTVGGSNPLASLSKGSYDDGYAAAIKKAHEAGLVPPAPTESRSLAGTVKSTGSDSFVLAATVSFDPLGELNLPKERTVTLAADAKITRQTPKSAEEQQRATAEFQDALRNFKPGDTIAAPPTPYTEESISLSDLKAGDQVTVAADHNILKESSFSAVTVSVQPPAPKFLAPVTPPTPPAPPTP